MTPNHQPLGLIIGQRNFKEQGRCTIVEAARESIAGKSFEKKLVKAGWSSDVVHNDNDEGSVAQIDHSRCSSARPKTKTKELERDFYL